MAKAPKAQQTDTRVSPGESSNRPIVLVALELEARGLNAIIPGADVVVCGPGREGIRRWADANPRPGRPVIMSGLGGGIDHALPKNSVVVARDVYNPHGPTLTSPLAPAITEPNLPRARFTSSLRTVASTAAKADLHRTSGAGVVDMESVPFSSIAHQHKWHWGIVRVISEPADTTLPTAVDNWVDHKGRTRTFAVIRDMIQRPTILSQIRGIRERSQEAIEYLAQALAQIKLEDGRVAEPVPEVLRRQILLFGGTFDPPHRAHVDMPFEVARRIGCTDVVYVPANVNPLKVDTPPTSPKHRLEMLRRALAGKSGAKISRCELERPGPSYMVDTLEILRKELRGKDGTLPRIRLMMGSDQALQFTKWHEWKRILDYATPVVVLRPPLHPQQLCPRSGRSRRRRPPSPQLAFLDLRSGTRHHQFPRNSQTNYCGQRSQ